MFSVATPDDNALQNETSSASPELVQRPWRQPRLFLRPVDVLREDQVQAIHNASLRILEEVGVDFLDDAARQVLLAAGAPGKRFALPHARVLIHQPYTEGGGQGSDIEIQANEILRMRVEMEGILSKHTGRTPEQVAKDIERDKILTAADSVEYGVIDQVIASRKMATAL